MEETTNEKTPEVVEQVEEKEEVESTSNEEVVEETTEEDVEEDTSTPEFDENTEEKQKQSDEENSKYAQIRRKYEEDYKKKLDAEVKKSYERGKLEAYINKVNPYTNEEIKDLHDVEMYETMYKLESEGKDPINDLPNYLVQREREKQQEATKRIEEEKKAKEELDDFTNKYPNVDVKELLDDKFFSDYITGKQKPLVELYEGFNNFKNAFRNSAVEVAKQTIANSQSTPGTLSNGGNNTIDWNSMSSEDFEKWTERAINGELR